MASNTIQPGAHILVTGATGYIGAHVVDQLLKAGYNVTGTARSQSKADAIQAEMQKYGSGRLKFVITGDLEAEGTFDDAVKEVDAIAHVASPTSFAPEDPIKDIIQPAIRGTLSLLQSALEHGKNVKHIVVTSSIVSVVSPTKTDYVFTEKDWDEEAYEQVRHWKKGDPVDGRVTYTASKTEAEHALWNFQKEKSPHFTINTVLPSVTMGPIIPKPQARSEITGSPGLILTYFTGENRDVATKSNYNSYVSVEDVALAHVRAIERGNETNGERFIVSAGEFSGQEIVDIMRKHYPERASIIEEGHPGNYSKGSTSIDGSKATRVLGIEYKGLEPTLVELLESFAYLYTQ